MGKFMGSLVVVLLLAHQFAHATPGGVDANGCHRSATAGHHCHPERATGRGSVQTVGGNETVRERERRLKRECKGRPNAGACLGYAS